MHEFKSILYYGYDFTILPEKLLCLFNTCIILIINCQRNTIYTSETYNVIECTTLLECLEIKMQIMTLEYFNIISLNIYILGVKTEKQN